jgi:hypothetical protein
MKQLLLTGTFLLVGLFSINVASAQCAKSAEKACCASKASTSSVSMESDAIKVAMNQQGVKKQINEQTGAVSYYIASVSPDGSTLNTQEVAFDENLGKFVNVAPSKACCAKGSEEAKACDKKEASTGKACCASKAEKSSK